MKRFILFLAVALSAAGVARAENAARKLTIGTTLHPYYSFTVNIAGDLATVVPLIETGFNPHNYQPQPADLKRATTLDVLVLNGV